MTLEAMQCSQDYLDARQRLIARGASLLDDTVVNRLLRRLRLKGPAVGDLLKSWDVYKTLEFLEANVACDDPILDMGAYCSEILHVLDRCGYSKLYGIDLNPKILHSPSAERIHFSTGDFMATQYSDAMFSAIVSISAIEHGLDTHGLTAEVSRILKPKGFLVVSTDYWPQKISTDGKTLFDLPWIIFSKEDIVEFLRCAATHNLLPVGELSFDISEPVIHYQDREYTFAWLVLQKRA